MRAAWISSALALGAGGSLASGHVLAGCVLTIVAIARLWSWLKSRDDDERRLGPPSRLRMG
jgi:hypothetical protein